MSATVDSIPIRTRIRVACQGWRCRERSIWNRWAGFYCYDHAIRAGWLPGVVRYPGTQMGLAA